MPMPSFSDFLNFINATFNNWATWVTGTGIIGLLLFVIGVIERRLQRQMRWPLYSAVLFCSFWFFATFSAWRDANGNLATVVGQRAADNSSWNTCKSDLKLANFQAETWKLLGARQQETINGQQRFFNGQQRAIDSCVLALAKTGTPAASISTELAYLTPMNQQPGQGDQIGAVIAQSDKRIVSESLLLTCNSPFTLINANVAQSGENQRPQNTAAQVTASSAAIKLVDPPLDPNVPLIFLIRAQRFDNCEIQRQHR
jgi:hypothetical protein